MTEKKLSSEVLNFDSLPASALVQIKTAVIMTSRCRQTLYRHIQQGLLKTVRSGGSVRIPVESLRSYLAGMP